MVSSSAKRFSVYLLTIVVLLGLWLGDEFGYFSAPGVDGSGVFRPPRDEPLGSFSFEDNAGDATIAELAPTPDLFEQELRRLAESGEEDIVDDEGGESLDAQRTPTPREVSEVVEESESRGPRLEVDDARSVFSELQPEQGSQVTDVLGGVVVRNPQGGVAPVVTPDLTPTGRGWVSGQARGYTMLYAMQPEARAVVEANVEALLNARVREPYIGVLIDGTFGRNFGYLKEIIQRLSSEGRALTLVLYLSNGPTMRKWEVTPIDQHIFARISPEDFRLQIRRNARLRAEFLAVVLQAKDVFQYSASVAPGNTNLAIVMLEDNLDVLAYRSMREIAAEQLGTIAGFVRNPCVKCWPGNDDDTLGDAREEHELARFNVLRSGDGYSLDGVSFKYPNGEGAGVSAEQLGEYLTDSVQRGLRYFGLWREEWQGVRAGVPNKRPEERTYIASLPDQQVFEIEMLRTGLIAEAQEEGGDERVPSP